MKPYQYDPNSPFEAVINLSSILDDAKNGRFVSVDEIRKEINEIIRCTHHTHRLAKAAFLEQSTCNCAEFTKPQWSLRKNLLNYYYHFEKKCTTCGKTHCITLDKWNDKTDPMPEGYEDAVKVYWNLNI